MKGSPRVPSKGRVGKPDRHVYSLTDKGREELRRWLIEPVRDQIGRIEIALKLFFGHQVSAADSIRQVDRFREMRNQEIRALRAIEERLKTEQANNPNLPYMLATVSYGQHVNQALLDWCEETLSGSAWAVRDGRDKSRERAGNRDDGEAHRDTSPNQQPGRRDQP